ncbi:carotene hydroxylase [Algivirga pacifica]|uniref:Sterol desaturase family protein n=1 Tax=Algivirga pacifica TaxID=1162670 RepID=A0ABP9CZ13_9BACT
MEMLTNILVLIGVFWLMEFVAWFAHKYVMHGFLWKLHEDHHSPYHGIFQKNDSFFLIFAIPSWLLIMFGMMHGYDYKMWAGFGIALYGLVYFFIHELFIHQRLKVLTHTDNAYLKAIRKAHKVHHKHQGKEDGECFGMLVVPLKFYREQRKKKA